MLHAGGTAAISRVVIVIALIMMIIVVSFGAYMLTGSRLSTNSTFSSTSSSSSSSSSATSNQFTYSTQILSTASISSTSFNSSTSGNSQISTSTQSSGSNGTLVIDDALWPFGDMNQLYAFGEQPFPNWATYTVYQSLVTVNQTAEFNQGSVQYLPGLAQNWTVSADGATYTFNLRQVNFSDGNPLNAYQVWMEMYCFYYLSGNSSGWLESYPLFNMTSANFGPATIALINSSGGLINPSQVAMSVMKNSSWPIYVAGPMQIVFHLKAPFVYFPGTLVVFDGLIFDSQWVLENGGFGNATSVNSYFNQHPIPGTGPYVVSKVKENNYVEFAQNPNYWGTHLTAPELARQPIFDPGHVKNVIINAVSDDLARYTDLSTGVAQISPVFSPDWNLVLANPNKFSYLVAPSWAAIFGAIALNTNYYPTNITLVRQAIVHAINYSEIWNKAFLGEVSPMVGPEYPAWKDFYDLGNYSAYNYNVSLALSDLKRANITNMPTFSFRTLTTCGYCTTVAEIVQSDLSQIGIVVNIDLLPSIEFFSPYGSYANNVANAPQEGQMSLIAGAASWAPATLTPADYWLSFVSNSSVLGDQAGYARPDVQACVNSFTSMQNVSLIQALCKKAQAQIYNDAPYAWLGIMKLWFAAGSLVWNRNVVKSFYVDPVWSGQTDTPIFNTVTFVN